MSTLDYWLVLLTIAMGAFATYMDLEAFFVGRGLSLPTVIQHWNSVLFIAGNAVISGVFLVISLTSNGSDPISKVIQVSDPWQKAIIIAFGVPMLIRSKLFTIGDEKQSVGVAFAYDYVRNKVLYGLANRVSDLKDKLALKFSKTITDADFPDRLKERVVEVRSKFVTAPELDSMIKQFDDIQKRYSSGGLSPRYIQSLIRWASDYIGLAEIESWLTTNFG
jgi:hypothetical protein